MPGAATAHWALQSPSPEEHVQLQPEPKCPQGAANTSLSRDLAIKETLWFWPLWIQTTSAAWSSPAMWNCSTYQAPVSIAGHSWPQTAGKAKLAHLPTWDLFSSGMSGSCSLNSLYYEIFSVWLLVYLLSTHHTTKPTWENVQEIQRWSHEEPWHSV